MGLLKNIEQQLNRILLLDEETLQCLAQLSGKAIAVEIENTKARIVIRPDRNGVHLSWFDEDQVDVTIRGLPGDLLIYVLNSNNKIEGVTGKIEVSGDVTLAQDFQKILKRIDLDWEELFSHKVGDSVAHKLGRIVKSTAHFVNESGDKLQQDVSEYLRFEKMATIDKAEMIEFSQAVDTLRNDSERLKQRISRLDRTE